MKFKQVAQIEAKNKAEAKAKAKNNDWYDAEGDEYTGDIHKIIVKDIKEEK